MISNIEDLDTNGTINFLSTCLVTCVLMNRVQTSCATTVIITYGRYNIIWQHFVRVGLSACTYTVGVFCRLIWCQIGLRSSSYAPSAGGWGIQTLTRCAHAWSTKTIAEQIFSMINSMPMINIIVPEVVSG